MLTDYRPAGPASAARNVLRAAALVGQLTYKWARHRHRNKPTKWIVNRYFGRFNASRRNVWVFGDRDSGAYLHKFAWTNIVRHQIVTGTASVDDPALADYWTTRRRRITRLPVDYTSQRLLDEQRGQCPICDELLLHADHPPQSTRDWELWIGGTRKALERNAITLRDDGTPEEPRLRLLHTHCHRRNPNRRQTSTAARQPATGLA